MSNPEEKNLPLNEETKTPADEESKSPAAEENEALDSFLSRESAPKKASPSAGSRRGRTIATLMIISGAVLVLVGMIFLLRRTPQKASDDEDIPLEAWYIATVDEAGMHVVEVPTDGEGNPSQNGYGTLIEYDPFRISQIRVENTDASFTIHAHTDAGEHAEYRLEGYKSFSLQTGIPDNVANDVIDLHFLTIAGVGKNPADYGLSSPRARVSVTYTDGTSASISVGDDAPAGAGTYISFGNGDSVFLVNSESVDSFFYKPTDFISCEVSPSADSTGNAAFSRITLSGSRYPQKIVLEPNTDEAVDYDTCVTAPAAGFADAVLSAEISGSIRGLTAESVFAVNADGTDTATFLAAYQLDENCQAEVTAVYPDATLHLRAGSADSDSNVCLVNMDDPRVIYKIPIDKVRWASTSLDQLTPDTILRVRRTSISNITLISGEQKLSVDVDTRTQTVDTTDGGTEEVTTTEAYVDDKLLGDNSFTILLQNLTEMKNDGKTDAPADAALLEIRYTYTTGRTPDTIVIYESDSLSCAVALNGSVIGSIAKSYARSLVSNVSDVIAGKVPSSL